MSKGPDIVDITGLSTGDAPPRGVPRPFLGLRFTCSGHYTRANKTADGTAYLGRCPKCAACVRFPIGQGGTSQRFFEVSCRG